MSLLGQNNQILDNVDNYQPISSQNVRISLLTKFSGCRLNVIIHQILDNVGTCAKTLSSQNVFKSQNVIS